jgi:hypothetical protein
MADRRSGPARREPDVPRRFALVRGVRFRITAVAALAAAAVLTVAGSVLLVVQREQLFAALDASLVRQADDLASSGLDLSDPPREIANLSGDDSAVTANALAVPPIGPPATGTVIRTTDTLPIEDDEYRVLSRPFPTAAGAATVHVATNTDDVRDVMARLRATLWVVVPAATLGLCAVVWWLVGRTLRPVEAIRSEVAVIGAEDLARGDRCRRAGRHRRRSGDRRSRDRCRPVSPRPVSTQSVSPPSPSSGRSTSAPTTRKSRSSWTTWLPSSSVTSTS